jgi:BNR repeat protein
MGDRLRVGGYVTDSVYGVTLPCGGRSGPLGRLAGLWAVLASSLALPMLPAQTIRVGANIQLVQTKEDRPLAEPHIAVHPAQARHLLAAAIVADPGEAFSARQTCAVFLSADGGRSWQRHNFAIAHCGDPWVAITPSGQAVFAVLGTHPAVASPTGGIGLLVFHSSDGGRTWPETPLALGRGHDHETLAVDASSPKRAGWLYLISGKATRAEEGRLRWSVFVARSRNGGRTFDDPVTIVPSNLNINAELSVVLSDGTLLVSFVDFQRNVDDFAEKGRLERRRVWVMRSTDGGRTFSVPLFASEECGRGWSALAVDTSTGPFRDRVYLACRSHGERDVVLHYSADGGERWSDPTPVHGPASDTGVVRTTPALAVNPRGIVAVAWMEARTVSGRACQRAMVTASLDGGHSFIPERPLADSVSCPDASTNGAALRRWPTGGDYFGFAAAPDGRFHAVWPDARNGTFQLRTSAVDVEGQVQIPKE